MNKWADFGISAVSYNQDKTQIIKLKVHEDNVESMGQAVEKRRKQIFTGIKKGQTFTTVFPKYGGLQKGEEVNIIIIDGEEFLRTDINQEKSDHLDNLTEF
jgi:hypothetical protein